MKRKTIIPFSLVCLALPLMACEGLSGKDGKTIDRSKAEEIVEDLEAKHASADFAYPTQFHMVSSITFDQKDTTRYVYDTVTDYVQGQYYHMSLKSATHDYTTSADTDELSEKYYFLKDGKYYFATSYVNNTDKKSTQETTKEDFEAQMLRQKTSMIKEISSDDESLKDIMKNAANPGAVESSTSTADPSVYSLAKEQYRSKGDGSLAAYVHLKVTTKEHGYGDEIGKIIVSDYLPVSANMSITGKGTLSEAVSGSSEDLTLHEMSLLSSSAYDWANANVVYPDETEYPLASSSIQA
jgi:hypothetical protein